MDIRPGVSCLLILSFFVPSALPQQQAKLTVETVMRGPQYSGYAPQNVRWSGNGQKVYFEWKRHTDLPREPMDTYVANRDGSGLLKLTPQEIQEAPPASCNYDARRERCVYTRNNDVWLYDFRTDKAQRIIATSDAETAPRFAPAGDRIYFQRGNNLFALNLASAALEQLSDIRTGKPDPEDAEPAAEPKKELSAQDFLKQEEAALLTAIKERNERKKAARERRLSLETRKPHYLGPQESISSWQVTANGEYLVATVAVKPEGAKTAVVPNYVADTGFTENIETRTKVGDAQAGTYLAVVNTTTGEFQKVEYPLGEKPKATRVISVITSDDGAKTLFLLRSVDNKDLWRLALEPKAAKARVLAQDHDDAWIGGPNIYFAAFGADHETVYFQSERTGYSHLYAVPFSGGNVKALSEGKYEVDKVAFSRDKRTLYLTTSEVSPFERHFYTYAPETGQKAKITKEVGNHEVTVSPDDKYFADIYSFTNKPDELFTGELKSNAELQKLTNSPSPDFLARKWLEPAIVEIPARDGVKIPGRLYKPANARRNSPAVIFVHGAGYLQNVHRWWSSYYREYMFHHVLVEAGYIVLDIDYRASAGYGRDWRTGIYRHMGGKDLEDHVDAAKWLTTAHFVNPRKIGIYGGSYGGFMTLMALFTSPGTFASGAALRPVTDWAHYNHPYTSNILNEPQKDPEAYRKSSPIYHAAGLQGHLLICHGMVDINVHYQDSVRLAQKLIELGKENWELASYPVEDHGFVDAASWTDEYKRIFKLFERTLK
jgi:dipeptidyl aminopeptidase/acylaminoacyl peptidase